MSFKRKRNSRLCKAQSDGSEAAEASSCDTVCPVVRFSAEQKKMLCAPEHGNTGASFCLGPAGGGGRGGQGGGRAAGRGRPCLRAAGGGGVGGRGGAQGGAGGSPSPLKPCYAFDRRATRVGSAPLPTTTAACGVMPVIMACTSALNSSLQAGSLQLASDGPARVWPPCVFHCGGPP